MNPKVELVTYTSIPDGMDPADYLSLIANQSHGINPTPRPGLYKRLMELGHTSIDRFLHFTFRITCSYSCHTQLIRHSVGVDYLVQSTRYVKPVRVALPGRIVDEPQFTVILNDGEKVSWTIKPDGTLEIDSDVPNDIARYFFPQGIEISFYMVANLEELKHIYRARSTPGAAPEIRQLVNEIDRIMKEKFPSVWIFPA